MGFFLKIYTKYQLMFTTSTKFLPQVTDILQQLSNRFTKPAAPSNALCAPYRCR